MGNKPRAFLRRSLTVRGDGAVPAAYKAGVFAVVVCIAYSGVFIRWGLAPAEPAVEAGPKAPPPAPKIRAPQNPPPAAPERREPVVL
ncbi:MAG: hypothetical protein ACT4O3_07030 [Elusimicrobiota bacterium]